MRAIARLVTAGLWVATGLAGTPARAQSALPERPTGPATVLDVPYLPQSELLCGGAALAMIERWWGRRGVYARDFAELVRPDSGGILTTDLVAAVRSRGWDSRLLPGTPDLVQEQLHAGIPVLALIQVGRDRYHYVVLLGWSEGRVVFHDPAAAPFTSMDETRFLARWSGADRWALAVRPAPAVPATAAIVPADPVPADSMPCRPWLDRALDAAADARLDAAALLLAEAGRRCPGEPLVLRELAGVRFKAGHHADAVRLAAEYLALVPDDRLGWQLLASSRFLTGDREGALEAWNRVGRPTVDLVRIEGTRAIRFQGVAGALSVPDGAVLTPARLALARRRVSEVPALRLAAVEYQPVPGGSVELRVAVLERPVVGHAGRLAVAGAIRALAHQELGIQVATPTGAGELWGATWRWEPARTRVGLRLELPGALGFPGVVGIEAAWERFRFAPEAVGTAIREESRRFTTVRFGGWLTTGVRPSASLRLERWAGNRRYLAAAFGAELRAGDDRFVVTGTSEHAFPLSNHPSYSRAGARARWASSLGLRHAAWSVRAGYEWASRQAPMATWPAAGGDLSWAIPLRAHASARGGVLAGPGIGRGIVHAGLSADHPVHHLGPLSVAAGVFLDGADVVEPANRASGGVSLHLDGGGGVRIGLAEGELGVLRIDLARSLRGGRGSALTVGVHSGWPPF